MTISGRVGSWLLVVAVGALASHPAAASTAAPSDAAGDGQVSVVAAAPDRVDDAARAAVAAMSLRERAASVVMGHIPTADPAQLREYMTGTAIGGFILMGANVPGSEAELRRLSDALTIDRALPALLAIDQEGGDVSRLPWDAFPSALTLKDEPPAAAGTAFAGRGALVLRAGLGVNFGVVADETDDPSSFIYRRALGTAPGPAGERVAAAVAGESESVVVSTLKHFPGHGAAPGDSHQGIPSTAMSKQQWREADAVPFVAGIDAGAGMLMFGHLAYTAVDPRPASLSAEWHRIAREELGFTGVAITDDLGMLQASGDPAYADPVRNAVAAVAAGNDMVLAVMFSGPDTAARIVDGLVAAVEAGDLNEARLSEAAERVTALRLAQAAAGTPFQPCDDCAG